MLTRKHYVALAEILSRHAQSALTCDNYAAHAVTHNTALDIAHMLAQDNPRFNRTRFLTAAGFPTLETTKDR